MLYSEYFIFCSKLVFGTLKSVITPKSDSLMPTAI